MAGLDEVRAAALRVFPTAQAADAFLRLRSPALGGIPLELVEAGRGEEVIQFLQRLAQDAPPELRIFGIPLRTR